MKKAFLIIVALLLVSIAVNVWQWQSNPEPSVVVKHDTMWRDSIIEKPTPTDSGQTGRVVYIRVPVPGGRDTLRDTIRDSVDVPVPIMQKRYEDSLYTAWVSGFRPNLDSIALHLPEVHTTITKTIVKPSPLITVGIQTGAGYGFIHHQPDFWIGFGAQLNLWRK